MSRLFKAVVLYLSMLAIPVQGYAALTLLHCAPAHQHTRTAQETAHGHANDLVADHQHQIQAAPSPDSIAYALIDAAGIAHSDRALEPGGKPGVHESSEHEACSVGAAIPASILSFQPAEPAIERSAPKQFLNIAFVTDAPKRPPRSFLD